MIWNAASKRRWMQESDDEGLVYSAADLAAEVNSFPNNCFSPERTLMAEFEYVERKKKKK